MVGKEISQIIVSALWDTQSGGETDPVEALLIAMEVGEGKILLLLALQLPNLHEQTL